MRLVGAVLMVLLGLSAVLNAVNWVQQISLANRTLIQDLCVLDKYVVAVGYFGNDTFLFDAKSFIALLDKDTGKVVTIRKGDANLFIRCLTIEDKIYAFSLREVFIFDEDLNLLKRISLTPNLNTVAYDGKHIYLAYSEYEYRSSTWTLSIEKRTPNLELISSKKYTFSTYGSINDIDINPRTGDIWAVGHFIVSASESHAIIVILYNDLEFKQLIGIPPTIPTHCFITTAYVLTLTATPMS